MQSQNQLSQRLQSLAVDHGEYYCPLCRQLANSVIPLMPGYKESNALVQFPAKHLIVLSCEISELLAMILSEVRSFSFLILFYLVFLISLCFVSVLIMIPLELNVVECVRNVYMVYMICTFKKQKSEKWGFLVKLYIFCNVIIVSGSHATNYITKNIF